MSLPRGAAVIALSCSVLVPLAVRGATEWEEVRASYGNLIHVAGPAGDQNVNSWSTTYEGGSALTAELSNPHMTMADAAGNLYIADKESHSILKVTPAGTIHTVAGTHVGDFNGDGPALQRHLNNPNGVFVLADGTFYIIDLSNLRIRRVGTDGQLTTVVTETSLLFGRALWVSPDEQLIYYASRDATNSPSLKRWTPSGSDVLASGFTSLGNITVDPNGAVIVTEDVGNRVYRIHPVNGTRTLIAGNGTTSGGGDGLAAVDTGLNRVRGVACLPNGGIFLVTQKGAHIWYVDTAGIIHKVMDCAPTGTLNAGNNEPFTTPGIKMSEPRSVALAPNGDLLITASDYGQIRVVKCLRPPPPPTQLRVERAAPTALRLRWSGTPWQSYLVEHSPQLSPASWQVIGIRTSVPNTETLHALPSTAPEPRGFYRLRAPR
ncbi:MAG: hypothetical protein JWQ44_2593 [Chthoniobacter sp.]|nr:hypothetical protein [Chthoniobacter sp.]